MLFDPGADIMLSADEVDESIIKNHCDNAGANAGEKSVDAGIFHQIFEYRRN